MMVEWPCLEGLDGGVVVISFGSLDDLPGDPENMARGQVGDRLVAEWPMD
jgi:hypothetical protein